MAGDTYFKQLAQKLDFCEPERARAEQTEGAWLESIETAVVVIAMIDVFILLYKSFCKFSNKAKNKKDDVKKIEKKIEQEGDNSTTFKTKTDGKENEKKIKQEDDISKSGKRRS